MAKKTVNTKSRVNGFDLINPTKVERALNGVITPDGKKIGGVVKEDGSFDPAELLAEYDKLGGAIKHGTDKVKTGSFFDFANKKPFEKPEIYFIYRINGQVVEVKEGKGVPGIVKAERLLAGAKAKTDKKNKK
ncbi:MAG: hypothetical protein AAB877_00445 [Patescibacteria group bacterium]